MGRNHDKRIVSEINPIYEIKDWRTKQLRVAAYARVSTDSSDQENSLRNQKQHYEEFISANPHWDYISLYSDDGISGTSLRNRKGFNRMVEDCRAGLIDLVVVKAVITKGQFFLDRSPQSFPPKYTALRPRAHTLVQANLQ